MPDAPRRPRRALVRLAVFCGTLAVALVAADVWVGSRFLEDGKYQWLPLPPYSRISGPSRAQITERLERLERTEPGKALGAYDQDLGWDNVEGVERRKGVEYRINAIGARGAVEFPEAPPADKVRVLCFGESFTYGSEALDGEDWPTKVARIDERLEMINMGVGGYGTDQVLLRMRRDCARLRPRGVLIGYMLENCLRNVNRWRSRLFPDTVMPVVKPRFVLSDDGELELVPLPYATRADVYGAALSGALAETLAPHEFWAGERPLLPFSNISKLLTARDSQARRAWPPYYDDLDSEPMRVTLALLEECYREALASGAQEALVLVFPSRPDLRDMREAGSPYWREFLAELERRGIPYEDTTSWLLRQRGTVYGESHFNAKGNDTVAEGVWLWASEVLSE